MVLYVGGLIISERCLRLRFRKLNLRELIFGILLYAFDTSHLLYGTKRGAGFMPCHSWNADILGFRVKNPRNTLEFCSRHLKNHENINTLSHQSIQRHGSVCTLSLDITAGVKCTRAKLWSL